MTTAEQVADDIRKYLETLMWLTANRAAISEPIQVKQESLRALSYIVGILKDGKAEYQKENICPSIDSCPKITMIMGKDLLDWQYVEAVKDVCALCGKEGG